MLETENAIIIELSILGKAYKETKIRNCDAWYKICSQGM